MVSMKKILRTIGGNIRDYNRQINAVLTEKDKNEIYDDNSLEKLSREISKRIHVEHQEIPKDSLSSVVTHIISKKYVKVEKKKTTIYVYDVNSSLNQESISSDIEVNSSDLVNSYEEKVISSTRTKSTAKSDSMSSDISCGSEKSESEPTSKVTVSSYLDLVSHKYDYNGLHLKDPNHLRRLNRIGEIKAIPQFEQKSKEWLAQRKECLTATAIAIALDEDSHKYPAWLLLDKCGRTPEFMENKFVHHGKKYEEIANMYYQFRNNVQVAEYGMIRHSKYDFIGASPDGICEPKTLDNSISTLVGRLLEIKCPYSRKIKLEGKLDGDICPHDYYVQVQTQLFVTEMDECDFLQCEIGEYDSWEDYVADSDLRVPTLSKTTGLEKGCLIQLIPRKYQAQIPIYDPDEPRLELTEKEIKDGTYDEYMTYVLRAKYIYPESLHLTDNEIEKWISSQILNYPQHPNFKTHAIDRVLYFRFNKISCHLIKRDEKWFEEQIPILKQFWDYVQFYRANPMKLNDLVTFIKEVGMQNSSTIFEKVHKHYMRTNKKSTYEPLYQEKNKWRIRFDREKAFWESRNNKNA
jgi:putative phage-type endonuclease